MSCSPNIDFPHEGQPQVQGAALGACRKAGDVLDRIGETKEVGHPHLRL